MNRVCATIAACVLLTSLAAGAKKQKAPPAPEEPLDVVVLPFDVLRGKDARAAREALELELELVDNVRVQDNGALKAELDKARMPLTATAIKAAMAKRSIEVLVLTPLGYERPLVAAYGPDGRPRVVQLLPRGATPDQMAATALTALRPALDGWRALPAIDLPSTDPAAPDPTATKTKKPKATVDDDDVLADEPEPKRRRSIDDEEDEPAPPKKKKADPVDEIDDDDAAARKRRAALDDDEDENLEGGRRRTIDDVEDNADVAGPIPTHHTFAASLTFDGATWSYLFDGNNNVEPDPVTANFFPGGSLRTDLWFNEFVGVDAGVGFANVNFIINSSPTVQVAPSRFSSLRIAAGGAAKARAMLHFGEDGPLRVIGLGGRLGYRYWQGIVETQRVNGTDRILTVVPGFSLHSLAVGPEIYLPLFIGDRRLELELRGEALPLTRYAETPDNPGKNSLAFGYRAELLVRVAVFSNVMLELGGFSSGVTVNFEGEGDRITVEDGSTFVPLEGGRALNITAGFSAGLGVMF
jgi:hypothetical protein